MTAIRESKLVRKSIYVNMKEYLTHIQHKSSTQSRGDNLTNVKGRNKFTDVLKLIHLSHLSHACWIV